jgi:hypothetical protein
LKSFDALGVAEGKRRKPPLKLFAKSKMVLVRKSCVSDKNRDLDNEYRDLDNEYRDLDNEYRDLDNEYRDLDQYSSVKAKTFCQSQFF